MPTSKDAKRAYDAKRYQEMREIILDRAAEYYEVNKARLKAKRDAEAIAAGREPGRRGGVKRLTDAQRAENRRENVKAWRKANPEKWKEQTRRAYEKKKPEMLVRMRNQRARRQQAEGKHTAEDIAQLRVLQNDKCAWCLKPLGAETPDVDHYIPLSRGGTNDRKNLRLLHATCNRSKHAKHPAEFGLKHGLLAW